MKYSLYRLFLTEVSQKSLLSAEEESRSDYIKRVFSQSIAFTYRKEKFEYVFIKEDKGYLFAKIGRQKDESKIKGPEYSFEKVSAKEWKASNILINSSSEKDGQKIAFEENFSFSTNSQRILKRLVKRISDSKEIQWSMSVNTITESKDFWNVIEKYHSKVREVEMTFVAPNLFGDSDAITRDLKKLDKENNVKILKLSVRGENLNPDTQNFRDSIHYTSQGGGRSRIKSRGNKVIYDSEKHGKTVTVEDGDIQKNDRLFKRIIQKLFGK